MQEKLMHNLTESIMANVLPQVEQQIDQLV